MSTSPFGSPSGDDDFEVDLGEGDGGGGASIAEGTYAMRVVDVEVGESKAGNPMWTWTFAITGNEKGKKSEYSGKEVKLWTALTPAALWKLSETVQALQVPIENNRIKCKKADLVGKTCLGVIEVGEYNGRPSINLAKCLPL